MPGIGSLVWQAILILIGVLGGASGVIVTIYYFQETLAKLYTRLLYVYNYVTGRKEKSYIKSDIETTVNFYSEEKLGFEVPYGIEISWRDVDDSPHLEEGDVVVFLDNKNRQPKNIARAVLQYTSKGVVPDSRDCLTNEINEAMNYCVSLDVLEKARKEDARYILKNEVSEKLRGRDDENGTEFSTKYRELDYIRRDGTLGSILLREYDRLKSVFPPNDTVRAEAERFLEFCAKHALRDNLDKIEEDIDEDEIEVPFKFPDPNYFDITIAYVGGDENTRNLRDYVNATTQNLRQGRTVYLLAGGHQIRDAKRITNAIERLDVCDSVSETEYELSRDTFKPSHRNYCAQYKPVQTGD